MIYTAMVFIIAYFLPCLIKNLFAYAYACECMFLNRNNDTLVLVYTEYLSTTWKTKAVRNTAQLVYLLATRNLKLSRL